MYQKKTGGVSQAAALTMLFAVSAALVGCDNKEEVMEIETPEASVEVERDRETGAVSVDTEEE